MYGRIATVALAAAFTLAAGFAFVSHSQAAKPTPAVTGDQALS